MKRFCEATSEMKRQERTRAKKKEKSFVVITRTAFIYNGLVTMEGVLVIIFYKALMRKTV